MILLQGEQFIVVYDGTVAPFIFDTLREARFYLRRCEWFEALAT